MRYFVPLLIIGGLAINGATVKDAAILHIYEFAVRFTSPSENFRGATSDIDVISSINSQLSLPIDQRMMHINGAIDSTNGRYNMDWNWHFIPSQWDLAEISIEICDGIPSMVENDLSYWLQSIGHFCPYSSYVLREINIVCGDFDGDEEVNIVDIVFLIDYKFKGGAVPDPLISADANNDGSVNILDIVYLINYKYKDGPTPDCLQTLS